MEEETVGHRELEVVKKALVRILQEENPLPPAEQQAREDELSTRLSSHGNSPPPSQPFHPHDFSILSRLLHQVKLLEQEAGGGAFTKLPNSEISTSSNGHLSTENVVETVVQIASAAAEAARAAAASSGKNLEVMETLLSSSEKTTQHRLTHSASQDEEREDSNEEIVRPPFSDKDLVKKIERQNRFTHCVLGFMVVATAIWRFKLFSMFIGVRKSFSNPFQAFGEMVSDGLKGGTKEDQSGAKGFHKARTVLPSILGGEESEISKKLETKENSTSEDFKIGEAFTLSLDNILSVGKSSNDSDQDDTK